MDDKWKKKLSKKEYHDYKEAFKLLDDDESGTITEDELLEIARGMPGEVTETDLQRMIHQMDADGNGQIDFDEFVEFFSRRKHMLNKQQEFIDTFNMFDTNHNGNISIKDMTKALKALNVSKAEAKELVKEADADGNGFIDLDEFITLMKNYI
ncbi:hypothetical protein SNEBB_003387 [Seison nebaliae]|nr:hypothetical protein SNEBB_003387 [Seison nebaliae]